MKEETELRQSFDRIGTQLDKIIEILRGKPSKPEVVDLLTLAEASGLTPSDNTKMRDIQIALGLSDSATIQDAINAASN